MPPRSLGPVSTKYRMLSSQARANSGQHGSSPGAAVRRTLEQASVGASSCLLLDTARSPWAPAQAPRVARVATLGLSDSGPSPIGHGPIELDSNIWIWLQRTPVAVAVVSLAVMCSYGPDKLLGAFE